MASTYSSSLKIELIGVGDQTDAWGSTTNTNFQYALEEAIVGYATATFPSDNNYDWGALYVNSAGSQAQRNLVIQVTGTITATRNFIVPTIEKQYIIYNATTGGQSILVKTSAGTGITVPNGVRAHLYVDGVNVVSMLDYIPSLTAGSLALTTALPVASGGTGSATAQVAINTLAGAVTSGQYLRGNGTNVVMSAIQAGDVPTLNQNTTGTAANVTGIVAIANGGTGQSTATAAINALLPSQTSNTGKYLTTDGTNTSWGTVSTGVTSFSAGTTGLTPSTGTTGAVTLAGTLAVANGGTGATNLANVTVGAATNISGGAANRIPYNNGVNSTLFIAAPAVASFLSWTGSAFAWAASTATPGGSNTQVQYNNSGSFAGDATFTFNSGTSTLGVTNLTATDISADTVTAGNAKIKTPGSVNLGIGLNCIPASGVTGSFNTAVGDSAALFSLVNGNYNVAIGNSALLYLTNASNNTAVGAQALASTSYSGSNNTAIGFAAGSTTTSGSNVTCVGNQAYASSATVSNEITLGNSSIATLRCQVTTITALSDIRDKTNVVDIPMGLNFINTLRPVSFDWNMRDGGKVGITEFGFIAQDLKKAQEDFGARLPGLVHDENPDRLEAAPGTLIPVLVKAVQELSAQVEDLKRQLAAR